MKTVKQLGVWMDHSTAYMMELKGGNIVQNIIVSEFTHEEKESSISKSEKLMHNKEQQMQAAFFKEIGEGIKPFGNVLLFGPTDAKTELFHVLRADHHFDAIKFEITNTGKMNEKLMHNFVTHYFKVLNL